MSPMVGVCKGMGLDYFMGHTGRDCSCDVDRVFFEQLRLPDAKYNLDVRSREHGVVCMINGGVV